MAHMGSNILRYMLQKVNKCYCILDNLLKKNIFTCGIVRGTSKGYRLSWETILKLNDRLEYSMFRERVNNIMFDLI